MPREGLPPHSRKFIWSKFNKELPVKNRCYANLRDNYQRVFHFLFTKSFVLPKNTKQCNGLP